MNEVTILKSSILGGYNKKDVTQYIDAILEENSQNLKDLKQQIRSLTQENGNLKKQLKVSPQKQAGLKEGNTPVSVEKQTYSASKPLIPELKQDENADAQEMSLPEGTYIVSENHEVIGLPNPEPVYQTKETGNVSNLVAASDEGPISTSQEGEEQKGKKILPYTIPTDKHVDSAIIELPTQNTTANQTSAPEPPLSKENPGPIGYGESATTEASDTSRVQDLLEEIRRLKAELETEKAEKRKLEVEVEYSTNLLLKLYKNK